MGAFFSCLKDYCVWKYSVGNLSVNYDCKIPTNLYYLVFYQIVDVDYS